MQTILGSNGVFGRELSRALTVSSLPVRQVSRHPRRESPADELMVADLLDAEATSMAVAGSEVAYLVAGLKYDTAVWQDQWPRMMTNVIDACKRPPTDRGEAARWIWNVDAHMAIAPIFVEATLCSAGEHA